jgi:iron-sulfur cluster assembly accessory protein
MIRVTDSAVSQLRELLQQKKAEAGMGLRLSVERGGCAGMQYSMKLDHPAEGDEIVENGGVRFIVDSGSLPYVRDAEIDFVDNLSDSGFKIRNPGAVRSCGCGSSFAPAVAAGGGGSHPPEAS